MSKGDGAKAAQAVRFARYCELRDGGALPAEAASEVGLTQAALYERGYREARGLPRRRPGDGRNPFRAHAGSA